MVPPPPPPRPLLPPLRREQKVRRPCLNGVRTAQEANKHDTERVSTKTRMHWQVLGQNYTYRH
jgi:hypothetical protein